MYIYDNLSMNLSEILAHFQKAPHKIYCTEPAQTGVVI